MDATQETPPILKIFLTLLVGLLTGTCELFAAPPTLPVRPVNVARDVPDTLSVGPGALTGPTKLYTVCALGGQAEHGFIKDGKVYAPGGGGVACWELETGKVIRRYPGLDVGTMPVLEHGLLVGAIGGGVQAVFERDGKKKWHASLGSLEPESLVYWDDGKDRFVFVQAGAGLYKLRFDDGSLVASYKVRSKCIPALDQKNRWIYAQEPNRIVKLSADDLRPIWEVGLSGGTRYASPILVEDARVGYRVFANTQSGNVYSLASDGKIVWQHPFGGEMNGLMTYHEGILIEHGFPTIVRGVDAGDGNTLWVFDSKGLYGGKECFWTAPILIGGRLLIATGSDSPGFSYHRQKFFVLNPSTGQKLNEFEFDAPGSSCGVPMASAGIVVFHDNLHSRWTAVKVGEGDRTDWYPFRGDDAHTGAPAYQDRVVTRWYDEPQEKASWRQDRDWLFLDRFERPDAPAPGKAEFPPFPWKSEGPAGSTAVRGGELVVSGAGQQLVGVYNEMTAAPLYTVEGTAALNQTGAPNQWLVLLSNGWRLRLGLMAHSDGFIYYMNSSQKDRFGMSSSDQWIRSGVPYEANKPYAFKIRVDCEANTGEYSFDGKPLGKGRFSKYHSPSCVMAATQDSRGSFRLGEIAIYKGDVRPEAKPEAAGQ